MKLYAEGKCIDRSEPREWQTRDGQKRQSIDVYALQGRYTQAVEFPADHPELPAVGEEFHVEVRAYARSGSKGPYLSLVATAPAQVPAAAGKK